MEDRSIIDQYLLQRWKVSLYFEWPLLIAVGAVGSAFQWPIFGFEPVSNIIGGAVLVIGMLIHRLSHLVHQQAHAEPEAIRKVVSEGIYAKIRHPGYAGLILMYVGFPFLWGIQAPVIPAVIFIILTVITAVKEEEALEEELGDEYREYKQQVPWRFIPGIV